MQKSKGFTIIELLVVIAIIAVLAAIVLINVAGYINKGKDAAVQANLRAAQTNAVGIYNDVSPNSWDTVCDTGKSSKVAYDAAVTASGKTGNNFCNDAPGTFVACVELPTGGGFCVDSAGIGRKYGSANSCTSAITACPAS